MKPSTQKETIDHLRCERNQLLFEKIKIDNQISIIIKKARNLANLHTKEGNIKCVK